jgi:hypothetical protein
VSSIYYVNQGQRESSILYLADTAKNSENCSNKYLTYFTEFFK